MVILIATTLVQNETESGVGTRTWSSSAQKLFMSTIVFTLRRNRNLYFSVRHHIRSGGTTSLQAVSNKHGIPHRKFITVSVELGDGDFGCRRGTARFHVLSVIPKLQPIFVSEAYFSRLSTNKQSRFYASGVDSTKNAIARTVELFSSTFGTLTKLKVIWKECGVLRSLVADAFRFHEL